MFPSDDSDGARGYYTGLAAALPSSSSAAPHSHPPYASSPRDAPPSPSTSEFQSPRSSRRSDGETGAEAGGVSQGRACTAACSKLSSDTLRQAAPTRSSTLRAR